MKRNGLRGLLPAWLYSNIAQVATVTLMIAKDCPGFTNQLIKGDVEPRVQGAALTGLDERVAAALVGLRGAATGRSASCGSSDSSACFTELERLRVVDMVTAGERALLRAR